MPRFWFTGLLLCALAVGGCGGTHSASTGSRPADLSELSTAKLAGPPSSYVPQVSPVPLRLASLHGVDPVVLSSYLRAFHQANRALAGALYAADPNDQTGDVDYAPNQTWLRAAPRYAAAARAFSRYAAALVAITPPAPLRRIHRIYVDGTRRQEANMQAISDALRGTNAQTTEQITERLEWSQLRFTAESQAWERAITVVSHRTRVPPPAWIKFVGG